MPPIAMPFSTQPADQATPDRPVFLADHMAVKLGKYLRIAGFDVIWDTTVRTHELILRANREGRVFLTRNRHLPYAYPQPDRLWLLDSADPVEQLREVATGWGLNVEDRLFTRCIRCNVTLDKVPDKGAIRNRIHPNVYARYEQFYHCPRCGTVFWRGSHVQNTRCKWGL